MPQILLPALATAINFSGVGLAITGGLYFSVSTFAINAVLGAALYSLTPKSSDASAAGYSVNVSYSSTAESRKLIYGMRRKGGNRVFVQSTNNNRYLHMVFVFAAHESDSFNTIYFDEDALTLGGTADSLGTYDVTTPSKYNGFVKMAPVTVGSVANIPQRLINETTWTSSHILTDQTYIYVRLDYNKNVFDKGVPNISSIVKGRKILDTRTSVTAYSSNVAMCIRDYLMDTTFGIGAIASEINTASIEAAANVCDETVALVAGGTESRYEMHGIVDSGLDIKTNVSAMLSAMNGTLYWSNGQWFLNAGAYITPTVTLTEDDFAGPVKLSTATTARNNFNAVKGRFASPASKYNPTDYPEIISSVFEAQDTSGRKYFNLDLPYTVSDTAAQRIAKQVLYQQRQPITLEANFKLKAFQFQVGDTVMMTLPRYGFASKVFEVVKWTFKFDPAQVYVSMVLKETSSSVYSWAAEENSFVQDNTTLPDLSNPPAPTTLTATAGSALNSDGTDTPKITVTWDAIVDSFVTGFEIQYKLTADTNYTSVEGSSNEFVIQPVLAGNGYTVRVRSINSYGIKSAWTVTTLTASGDTTAPALPSSLVAIAAFAGNRINWTNPSDADFNYVEIYRNTSNNNATATKIGETKGSTYFEGNLANNLLHYYWLKSVDYSGNKSAFTTVVSATTLQQLDQLAGTIGTLRTSTSGERVEIKDNQIDVYDTANVIRVKIGNLI